ncbi:hypothetical protein ACP87_18220 [Pseudomonas oleovorans]|nr:hypothetical protein [Pseudomonas oleovorans]MBN7134247.1 hypothetical protein [Pseudomonas oleovorans]MBN7141730.1 hypothetical protein [Pseudomonas oleovorans]
MRNLADGVVLPSDKIVAALEALIAPGDRVVLEGNNQKQADFLSRSLAKADPGRLHDLHMIMPSVSRAEHLDLFERGIARKLDFSSAVPASLRASSLKRCRPGSRVYCTSACSNRCDRGRCSA